MKNLIKISLIIFSIQVSATALAESIKIHCEAKDNILGSSPEKGRVIRKDLEFTTDERKKEFTSKEIITKNENQYSLVISKSDSANISIYKIGSGNGKTKLISSCKGGLLSLIDMEAGVSVICKGDK